MKIASVVSGVVSEGPPPPGQICEAHFPQTISVSTIVVAMAAAASAVLSSTVEDSAAAENLNSYTHNIEQVRLCCCLNERTRRGTSTTLRAIYLTLSERNTRRCRRSR